MREHARNQCGHSLTELTSITTVCMGPPARLKPVNETRARACSDYDLILNATTSRTGAAAGRASVRAQAAAGAERRDNFIDNIKYGRNDFDYMTL